MMSRNNFYANYINRRINPLFNFLFISVEIFLDISVLPREIVIRISERILFVIPLLDC